MRTIWGKDDRTGQEEGRSGENATWVRCFRATSKETSEISASGMYSTIMLLQADCWLIVLWSITKLYSMLAYLNFKRMYEGLSSKETLILAV
jgi:hypothetical protein